MSVTRVGMIGYNEGNGHPYSFSAIINGYDSEKMRQTPYPVIADYLSERNDREFGIGDFKVTHIWTPKRERAEDIAGCTDIENVVDDYREMVEETDAVIIARDDAESHREISSIFLERGMNVFIDKPLCDTLEDLSYFEPWLRTGKLMSCSGFRYYPDIASSFGGELVKEQIVFSNSVSIIDWFKYGIHVLEGITPIMGSEVKWVQDVGEAGNHIVRVQYRCGKYALIEVNSDVGFAFKSAFFTKGSKHFTMDYDDNFSCFKGLLEAFYRQYKTGKPAIDPEETINLIKTLIAADYSLKAGGKKVSLTQLTV